MGAPEGNVHNPIVVKRSTAYSVIVAGRDQERTSPVRAQTGADGPAGRKSEEVRPLVCHHDVGFPIG